jgi:predicted phosphate transport protein (TIGR00153 family)
MAIPLGKLLGRSPITPIQQHMQAAEEAVQLLCQLLAASSDEDWIRVAEIQSVIEGTIADARALKRDIRQHLPRGLMLAMPRPDLLELLEIQERILDMVRKAALPIALRGTAFPKPARAALEGLCNQLPAAAGQALGAIRELDEMIEQGFGKHERKAMAKLLSGIDRQVQRCDASHKRLFRQLRKCEEDAENPLDLVFCYRIVEDLDRLAQACGEVGEQLDLLLAT